MIRVIEKTKDGDLICEDSESSQLFFQCMCGSIGMYERCLKLNQKESDDFRKGKLEVTEIYKNICNDIPAVQGRLVPPFKF